MWAFPKKVSTRTRHSHLYSNAARVGVLAQVRLQAGKNASVLEVPGGK